MPTQSRRRRLTRPVLAALALVVVLVVAVPFAYIHFIQGKAPSKFTLAASGTSGGPSVPLDGTWDVSQGSQAGYRVGEVLFGQNNTAVGRTSAVTGTMVISGSTVKSGSFTVNLTTIKSDQSQRDGQFQGRIMDTAKYPNATFTLTSPIDFRTLPAEGATTTATVHGNLTMHGATRPVTFPVTARHSGTTLDVLGSIPVVFSDYGIPNPSFAGAITTQDHGIVEFLLDFAKGTEAVTSTTTPAPTTTTTGPGVPPAGGFTRPTVSPTTVAPLGF